MEEERVIREFIRKEVEDWDSEVMVSARFKAFSGQRSDWEPRYQFWRNLIINIARHLQVFIIHPTVVKNVWFNQGGLIPLCLDHVFLQMYNDGDLICTTNLIDPKSGQLAQIFHKVRHLLPLPKSSLPAVDKFIIPTLLEEKSMEVVKHLCDHNWTSSCIVTMSKFQVICGGPKEASMILSHLSKCGKARYLAITRKDLIEGVKFSLSLQTVSGTTSSDYDVLHLTWTAEKLQLQLNMIDRRRDKSKMLALASLKSGNKVGALRQARELKLASESREKCNVLLRRVEEVLTAIAMLKIQKRFVFEAIQSGTNALKERQITIEEVQLCLDELDETINSQKQVETLIGSASNAEFDEDIEDELEKLELEESGKSVADGGIEESLSKSLSDLKLADNNNNVVVAETPKNVSKVVDDPSLAQLA
ncbi:hypothetical protein OSB04_010647 [Centaurea solstitialis]|uniref:Charged multivesicular body protein 7 n=1 Tax=Centaurea solstitialis TaxID=347529 RepID=A0AA38T800_9ASTR|nr:hypothetical protein OSB04_010647 [Centaurea solstitialis]